MSRSQACLVAALVSIAMVLVALLSVFSARKDVLVAEGADLATSESILVDARLQDILAHANRFATGTRVFKEIDPDTRVVAFVSGGWTDVPLHAGRALTGTPGEALVGAGRARGETTIDVAGQRSTVVGRLGVRAASLLEEQAVIVRPTLFADTPERLRVDGPQVAQRFRSVFPDHSVEIVGSGAERRTNVDVVTPVLTAAGWGAAVVVLIAAAVAAAAAEQRVLRVRNLVGAAPSSLVVGVLLRSVTVLVVCTAAASVTSSAVAGSLFVRPDVAPCLGALGCGFLMAVSALLLTGRRRWN